MNSKLLEVCRHKSISVLKVWINKQVFVVLSYRLLGVCICTENASRSNEDAGIISRRGLM